MTRRRPTIRAARASGGRGDRSGGKASAQRNPAEDWRWLELGRVLRAIADRYGSEILRRDGSESAAAAQPSDRGGSPVVRDHA
jgi:hypothetical protein